MSLITAQPRSHKSELEAVLRMIREHRFSKSAVAEVVRSEGVVRVVVDGGSRRVAPIRREVEAR